MKQDIFISYYAECLDKHKIFSFPKSSNHSPCQANKKQNEANKRCDSISLNLLAVKSLKWDGVTKPKDHLDTFHIQEVGKWYSYLSSMASLYQL